MLKLGKKEIHLWLTDDRAIKDADLLASYRQLLDAEETARHKRFIFDRHRHQFLVTRALVRSVLAQYEGADSAALQFGRNGYGKPHLCKGSRAGLQFNVSHCEGLIALAVVEGHDIGVDAENLQRKTDTDRLAERYFSPQEYRDFEELEGQKRHERFFDLWTLKESYIKACGMGLAIPLEEFSFRFEGRKIHIGFSPQRNDDPELWRFWQLRPGPQHKLALAITGKEVNGYRVTCRRGVPLRDFQATPCEILRASE